MKKIVLAAICFAVATSVFAGAEVPSPPAVPPPAYYPPAPVYYTPYSVVDSGPTFTQRVGRFVGGVWSDTVDVVREPIDLALNIVSLGTIDISQDDI